MITREQAGRIALVQEEIYSAKSELAEAIGTPMEGEARKFLSDRETYLKELLNEQIHHTAKAVVSACFPML